MAYRIEQPLPAWRRIDFPAVTGFVSASAGLIALIVEANVHGWWGSPPQGYVQADDREAVELSESTRRRVDAVVQESLQKLIEPGELPASWPAGRPRLGAL